jgi:hypothetical protein
MKLNINDLVVFRADIFGTKFRIGAIHFDQVRIESPSMGHHWVNKNSLVKIDHDDSTSSTAS